MPTFPFLVSFEVLFDFTAWTFSILCGGVVTAYLLGHQSERNRLETLIFGEYHSPDDEPTPLGMGVIKAIAETGELPRGAVVEAVRPTFRERIMRT